MIANNDVVTRLGTLLLTSYKKICRDIASRPPRHRYFPFRDRCVIAELVSTVPEARKVIKVKNPISVTGAEEENVSLSFGKYISSTETSTDGMADGLDDVI